MPVSRATDPAGPRCRGSDDRRVPAGHRRERADRGADARDTPRQQIAIGMLNDVQCGRLIKALCRSPLPVRVVLEATGIYFLDLACELVAAGIAVMVVNP